VFLEEFAQSQSHQSVAAGRPVGFVGRPPSIVVSDRRQCAHGMNELPKVNGFEGIVCRGERIFLVFNYFTVETPRKTIYELLSLLCASINK